MNEDGRRAQEEIFRLFLSAGYFRIRMPDLDEFDKIAGGLAWALKASSVDVDVDIFFKEKPNIGEKIRISESICAGLRVSKCPIDLLPYQIQGLDYPKLFPVVQHLVKNVIATRKEFGDFQRSYAEFTFRNRYAQLPSDMQVQEHLSVSINNVQQMERFFPPKRFYKRSHFDSSIAELKQIETTLLEYGRIPSLISAGSSKPTGKGVLPGQAGQDQGQEEITEKRNKELHDTLSGMESQTEESSILNGTAISGFVSAQADQILAAQRDLTEASRLATEKPATETEIRAEFEAKTTQLQSRLTSLKADGRALATKEAEIAERLEDLQSKKAALEERNATLRQSIIESKRAIERATHTEELMRAVTLRDETMRDVEAFEQQCRVEIKEWNAKIAALQEKCNIADSSEGEGRLTAVLQQYEKEWERLQGLLAEKTREVLRLRTDYDEVPTMAELTQYDRRISELGQLSLQKLVELKKCTQLCNSIADSQGILERENELFNSVLKTFDQAINGSSSVSQGLLQQLKDIAKATRGQQEKIKQQLQSKRDNLGMLDAQHRKLLENQRRYFQAVKEYQDAYERLEQLQSDDDDDE